MLRAVLLGVLLALTSLACSSSVDRIEPDDAVELTALELDLDLSEQELFEQGKRMYAAGLYALAQQSFERLRNGYPFGAYAEFAEVKIADCHSLLNEHDTAALLYEDFVKEHPASLAAPYALARAGRSQQLRPQQAGRKSVKPSDVHLRGLGFEV